MSHIDKTRVLSHILMLKLIIIVLCFGNVLFPEIFNLNLKSVIENRSNRHLL